MIKVSGRVAVDFMVEEKDFYENPDEALQKAVENGNATISDGDNYLPQPWNEDTLSDDLEVSLGVHSIEVNSKQ